MPKCSATSSWCAPALIRRLASGLYSWLPLGVRVLHKVERIIREEMDGAGALEVSMPGVQPAELWRESGRWDDFGPELLRLQDRHQRAFCLGPTHEEVITDIARNDLKSYRQLPINYYQIQTKFRDEIRPRFGVMRAREFVMKDAYSFHLDEGIPGGRIPGHAPRLREDLRPVAARLPHRAGRLRRHRRQSIGGVSRAGRLGRRRHRLFADGRICGESGDGAPVRERGGGPSGPS